MFLELVLGVGNFGDALGHGAEPDEARLIFFEALCRGRREFHPRHSQRLSIWAVEEILGELLNGRRDEFVACIEIHVQGDTARRNSDNRE